MASPAGWPTRIRVALLDHCQGTTMQDGYRVWRIQLQHSPVAVLAVIVEDDWIGTDLDTVRQAVRDYVALIYPTGSRPQSFSIRLRPQP